MGLVLTCGGLLFCFALVWFTLFRSFRVCLCAFDSCSIEGLVRYRVFGVLVVCDFEFAYLFGFGYFGCGLVFGVWA